MTPESMNKTVKRLRVHLTNVTALGPSQVVRSLLPALETSGSIRIEEMFLPDHGLLSEYERVTPGPAARRYRRFLPNVLSRALECSLLSRQFDGDDPLLILGDVPLRCNCPQVVFVQSSHIATRIRPGDWRTAIQHGVARRLFRINAARVSRVIVQTDLMRSLLETSYPSIRGRVTVIAQPPPSWLLVSGLRRTGRVDAARNGRLNLFYPAASYATKNHRFLADVRADEATDWPVERLALTIAREANPNPGLGWIDCVGFLPPTGMLEEYARTDAVVFLSTTESYGMPLVEAMHIGLPVIAPDLPYASTLLGDQAIYFDLRRHESLRAAVVELHRRLERGWWPDWSERLALAPKDWTAVARRMLDAVVAAA
jgi:glycosyltransferase involved in cell wall biosynthesis